MIALWIVLGVIGFLAISLIVTGFGLARYVARPKIITIPGEIEYEKKHGMWRNYEEYPKEEFKVQSFDGYELNTIFVPAENTSNKYVIISHGYGGCRLGSVKYLHMFRSLGFNCIMYDNRGHGDNAKSACTMGAKESKDLMEMIKYVYSRFGKDIYLGLHGESMGSALTNNSLQYKPDVRFIISDCGYNNLEGLLTDLLKIHMHLPKAFMYVANVMNKIAYGYWYKEVMPIDRIRENYIPICFMHGAKDDFILPRHAKEMAAVNPGYHELHIFENADHAYSVCSDEKGYHDIVEKFLEKVKELEQ